MFPATSKIGHIVRVRQMLLRWRKKSKRTGKCAPCDVPAGHVAVYVGASSMRFIVRATQLNHPMLNKFLVEAEEEYGFSRQGPLTIPCDERLFQEVLQVITRSDSARFSTLEDFHSRCHVDLPTLFDVVGESRPLLHS